LASHARVGIGYDIHQLVAGRPLVLGGVRIEYARGLLGHSDGDAVLHAVADALLGAAGLGDIGEIFPDTDPAFENADSRELLAGIVDRVRAKGFVASNVDLVIHAERPKLAEHKRAMSESIAGVLGISPNDVTVKATTNEGMGPVGNGDAIACTAVAMIVPS
jgi:2-C-methyl-D-erythritol 2,4-cyclodiphosphate synthase